MDKGLSAQNISDMAVSFGFESCGIVRLEALKEYEEKLDERIAACPDSKPALETLRKYARLEENYDWAKSVIVCVTRYSKYSVPENLEGLIGKYYLYDHKLQPQSEMAGKIIEFENWLDSQGIRFFKELHGITSGRMAAQKAGLGIIRKNNFFYSESGSWVIIDTWLIDRDMELIGSAHYANCPEGCTKCIDACPTRALSKPYCTNLTTCITKLTWGIRELPTEFQRSKMKSWVYGCDECQNACPMNTNTWQAEQNYPGLDELAEKLSLDKILHLDKNKLANDLLNKFWFIRPDSLWIWKVNALRAMANSYIDEYEKYFYEARQDENERVAEMAEWAIRQQSM
ncbi:MAG: 4Fe-4S double cluster binding domain-containing protein [Synergistota bacterium]|nr:4Fe-4S double cluster binding domain-containing protein [Synergistota bacterium]